MASPPLLTHSPFSSYSSLNQRYGRPTHPFIVTLYLLTLLFPGSSHFLSCRVPPVRVPQQQHPIGETPGDAFNEEFDNRVPSSLKHRNLHCPDARLVGTLGWTQNHTSPSISTL